MERRALCKVSAALMERNGIKRESNCKATSFFTDNGP